MSKEKEKHNLSNSTPLNLVVKENLTSEERARAEAKTIISEYANNSHISREYYAEGYLSGYHYRDEEVKELGEALREIVEIAESYKSRLRKLIVELSPAPEDMTRWKDFDIEEYLRNCNTRINREMEEEDKKAIEKAKQLLEE